MKSCIVAFMTLLLRLDAFVPHPIISVPRSLVTEPTFLPLGKPSPSASRTPQVSLTRTSLKQTKDEYFDIKTTLSLISGQTLLIPLAAFIAKVSQTPQWGFGYGVSFDLAAWKVAAMFTLPLALTAFLLDKVEDELPALQDVTMATQRSVLALLGGTFKPFVGLAVSICLGMAAGFGEELLFRGILQTKLSGWVGSYVAVGLSSIIFGLLHAVTPLYAILATIASIYFGGLFIYSDNLAVPILCHAIYDVGALLFAHWQVSRLSPEQQDAVSRWEGPTRM